MTSQENFLEKLIKKLNEQNIPYMLTGSVSSSLHGQPRATNDADIVIAPAEEQLIALFNVVDIRNSWKADFIICKDRPFSREEFQRRQKSNIMGLDVWVVSPEDVILSKLEWAKNSESGQQFQDALGVATVQYDRLDRDYLYKWAKELQVESSLEQLLGKAQKLLDSK